MARKTRKKQLHRVGRKASGRRSTSLRAVNDAISTEVKIYTLPACPYSKMAKVWFEQNKIPFQEINVMEDEAARVRIIRRSGRSSVPQIEIGNRIIVGFDREALEKKLLQNRLSRPKGGIKRFFGEN